MADDKKQMEPEDRLIYEPEEIKRMVDEYNKQKQIEYVDSYGKYGELSPYLISFKVFS